MSWRLKLCLAVYFALGAAIWWVEDWSLNPLRRLAVEGVQAEGTVTGYNSRSNTVDFTFPVGEQRWTGKGPAGDGLRPPNPVTVWYLPTDPSFNNPGDPNERLRVARSDHWQKTVILPALVLFLLAPGIWERKGPSTLTPSASSSEDLPRS